MTGRQTHLAELADCERALGRPERAIDLFRGADKDSLDKAGAIELLIVAAGARGDLGQHDAAVAMLQVRELTADEDAEWAVRLRYAYADALLAAGRRDEAREWFARAAAADDDNLTDAAERLLELDGVTIEGDDPEDEDEAGDSPAAAAGSADGEPATVPDDEEDEEFVDEAFDEDDEDEDDDAGIEAPEDEAARLTHAEKGDGGEDAEAQSSHVEVTELAEDESEHAKVTEPAGDETGHAESEPAEDEAEHAEVGETAVDGKVDDVEVVGKTGGAAVGDPKIDDLETAEGEPTAKGDKEPGA
jgi:tetratricopeptide (TPR) repeat protein